jgi:hypothetical protein
MGGNGVGTLQTLMVNGLQMASSGGPILGLLLLLLLVLLMLSKQFSSCLIRLFLNFYLFYFC